MKKISVVASILIGFASIIGYFTFFQQTTDCSDTIPCKPRTGILAQKPITIYIHGTRSTEFLPIGLSKQAQAIEESIHGGPPGLHHISDLDNRYHHTTIGSILTHANPEQFPSNNYFVYIWSGRLMPQDRYQAARSLYQLIWHSIIKPYRATYGTDPDITIITHSHGGNVALNLARVAKKEAMHQLHINRLILLACPILRKSIKYAQHGMFEKIINIHSHDDKIQVLDPQKFHPFPRAFDEAWKNKTIKPLKKAFKKSAAASFFSQRYLPQLEKITQIRVQWNGKPFWSEKDLQPFGSFAHKLQSSFNRFDSKNRGLWHIEFLLDSFFKQLPSILHDADKGTLKKNKKNDDFIAYI